MPPLVPAWVLILVALLSAHVVRREQGFGVAIPRFYIALLYTAITFELLGDRVTNDELYLAITRYGFLLVFVADIIPAAVQWWQARRNVRK